MAIENPTGFCSNCGRIPSQCECKSDKSDKLEEQHENYIGIKYTLEELRTKFEKSALKGGYSTERSEDGYLDIYLNNAWETVKLINKDIK